MAYGFWVQYRTPVKHEICLLSFCVFRSPNLENPMLDLLKFRLASHSWKAQFSCDVLRSKYLLTIFSASPQEACGIHLITNPFQWLEKNGPQRVWFTWLEGENTAEPGLSHWSIYFTTASKKMLQEWKSFPYITLDLVLMAFRACIKTFFFLILLLISSFELLCIDLSDISTFN